ncbi:N-acetyltransferase 10, partial [Dispira parvispora]
MGYGARALEQLRGFYSGEFHSLSESDNPDVDDTAAESLSRLTDAELENTSLQTDQIQVRDPRKMPPLLLQLSEKRAPRLHYLGVSYGVTASLYKFWKRSGFVPVYLRQTPNELTGEHTCVMLHALPVDEQAQSVVVDPTWLSAFAEDFHRRFLHLLSYQFRQFTSVTALGIMEAARNVKQIASSENEPHRLDTPIRYRPDLYRILSPFDLKRLESFSNSLLDYHVVMDLFPLLADLYFNGRLLDFSSHSRDAKGQRRSAGPLTLSSIQSGLFLAIGLQHKSVDEIEAELNLPNSQILGMLVKISKKIYASFKYIMNEEVDDETVAV